MKIRGAITLCQILLLASCAITHSLESRRSTAEDIARAAGMVSRQVKTGRFTIQSWYHGAHETSNVLEVYIEGDGLAWRRKHRLSTDPTPVDPVALRLASRVHRVDVLYLTRPCQYSTDIENGHCTPELWSSQRYSAEVVKALNEVIDEYVAETGAPAVRLVGYSGGGVIAALLAARRGDVERLVTIAANLDINAWTAHHRVSPLSGSLNPVDFAEQLAAIRQVHLAGEEDDIVPVSVVRSYLAALGEGHQADIQVMPGYSHDCCWADHWQELRRGLWR